MAKDNDAASITPETKDVLVDQVKKGKPRKFFLMFKGAAINTLVVFKKGAFQAKIMQAKKDGFKGDVCCGIVSGSGKSLIFQLPGSIEVATAMEIDNWSENPEIKPAKLREFLGESGLDFKPEFSVITRVADIPNADSDDEDAAPTQAIDAAPDQDNSALAAKLAETLKKLRPVMDQAIESNPGRKGELVATLTQIAGEIKSQQLEQAKQNITDFATLLKSLISNAKASGNVDASEGSTDLTERIQRLEPQLLQAVKLNPDKGTALMNLWNFINEKVANGDTASALKALDRLEPALLEALKSAPSSDSQRYGIREGLVAERVKELEAYFQQRIEEAKAKSEQEVGELEAPIDLYIENAKELVDAINSDLRALYDSVADRLMTVLKQGTKEEVTDEVESCRLELAGNKLLQEIAGANGSLGVQTEVMEQFADLFLDVTDRMERVLSE